jgi:transglutaminase-like putative cysteine protease
MRLSIDARLDYWLAAPADLLFALEVAQTPDQRLVTDLLNIGGVDPLRPIAADNGLGRRTWTRGEGRVTAHYTATVEVDRAGATLHGLAADDVKLLPADVVPFLFPSRYCESDRFDAVVRREFGSLSGGDRVEAMAAWIRGHLDYVAGSSDVTTTAADTYVAHRGVCRDFAHLLIAFVRAADIPARMVAAYAWRLDPPDFHAVVEVWLDGEWRLIDPTGLAPVEGLVRIGVGRDATDISFLTIFGEAECLSQTVTVERVD